MSNCNQDIRAIAKEHGVMLWEIAEALGITDGNFSRKLRRELSAESKMRIIEIVHQIAAQHAAEATATAAQ